MWFWIFFGFCFFFRTASKPHWAYCSSASGTGCEIFQLSFLLTILGFGFCFQNKIWSLKFECSRHSCDYTFILILIYNTVYFTRLAGSSTLTFKYPACMQLWQNKLQIHWTFFSLPPFSNASISGIIFCNQVGKKFYKLIGWCLTFWAFSSLWSVI